MEGFEILSHLALSSRLSQISSIITEAVPSLLLLMYYFICPSRGSEATHNTLRGMKGKDDQRSTFLFKVKVGAKVEDTSHKSTNESNV